MAGDNENRTTRTRTDVPRDEWRNMLEMITKDFQGYDATIEILSPEDGDQPEAEHLPLAFVEYDPKDDAFIVGVVGTSLASRSCCGTSSATPSGSSLIRSVPKCRGRSTSSMPTAHRPSSPCTCGRNCRRLASARQRHDHTHRALPIG